MRRAMGTGLFAAVLLLPSACGGGSSPAAGEAETTAAQAEEVIVELSPEHGSDVSGTATLRTAAAGRVEVSFRLTVPGDLAEDALPSHIHGVSCDEYRALQSFDAQLGTVTDHLASVDGGEATSTAATPLEKLTGGGFSINVHRPAHPYETVACGDIPER